MNAPLSAYDLIAQLILTSDWPRQEQKIDGLRRAERKHIKMSLIPDPCNCAHDTILVEGVAIDPSELESGYWL